MIEFFLNRTTVVSLAVIGGLFSIAASWCGTRENVSEKTIKLLNRVSYVFMGASMVLFVFAGLLSVSQ